MPIEKKEKILSVRINQELLDALTKAADDNNVTTSWIALKDISHYLKKFYHEHTSETNNEASNRDV